MRKLTAIRLILVLGLFTTAAVFMFRGDCNARESSKRYVLKIGGTWSLTGAYAIDMQAEIQGYKDYVRYVNDKKLLGRNVELRVLWGDDALNASKAISIFQDLKAQGILTFCTHATPVNLALKKFLWEAQMMATTTGPSPATMKMPSSICSVYSVYTDQGGAVIDWFMENWKKDRAPRFAYLTVDHPFGRQCICDQLTNYLKKKGMQFVGMQFVPLVVTSPPTAQLLWLKEHGVDLTFGCMTQTAVQPTLKEAYRLGMGPGRQYEIVFSFAYPAIIGNVAKQLGTVADGMVVGGSQPSWQENVPGIKLCKELQHRYHPNRFIEYPMYIYGVVEAMVHVEAVRLALEKVSSPDQLTPEIVLKEGLYRIRNFSTGGLTESPLSFGPDRLYGPERVRLDQVQAGKQVKLGYWPIHYLFPH
ncbi:MAG TPA: hypothetical protein ENG51_20065 [Deltaproteobacteria bacterium]|nr:MAG: hypothetical protein DRG83_20515 [Deltaproteobacteria bacterium]HDM78731.1 hypothetical protein [Deltaproteobacteria bacterium]